MRVIVEADNWTVDVITYYEKEQVSGVELVLETETNCQGGSYLSDDVKVKVAVPMSIFALQELRGKLDAAISSHIRRGRDQQAKELAELEEKGT